MKKLKSDVLLNALSNKELKSFNKFLAFRLDGKSKDVLNYWKAKYSADNGKIKEQGNLKFSRKTLSDFNKQLEKFYIFRNLEKDETTNLILLSRELRKRNIQKYYVRLIEYFKKAKSKIEMNNPRNRINLLNLNFEKYLLYSFRDDYAGLYKIAKEESNITEIIIIYSKLFEYFNKIFYINEKGYSGSALINVKKIIYSIRKNKNIYEKKYPHIYILYLLYQIKNNKNEKHLINTLLEYLKRNDKVIAEESLQFIYDSLFEILMIQLKQGIGTVLDDIYNILVNIEHRGVLNKLIHIRPRYFMLSVFLETRNSSITEKFLAAYKSKTFASQRKEVMILKCAFAEFSKGNFKKAKKLLQNIKPREPFLYIQHKIILLKTYYENNDLRHIYPLTDAFKHYLQRKNELRYIINYILPFLNCINKLVYAKNHNGRGLSYFKSVYADDKLFVQKEWLHSKYKEF